MRRTTASLDETLLRMLKKRAAERGQSLQDVMNDVLRKGLAAEKRAEPTYKLTLTGWKARVLPGVDLADRDALIDLMEKQA